MNMNVESRSLPHHEPLAASFIKQGITIPPLPDGDIRTSSVEPETIPQSSDYAWDSTKAALEHIVQSLSGITDAKLSLERPKNTNVGGEFAIPCFPLARVRKQPPHQIAQEVGEQLAQETLPAHVSRVYAEGAYVNFDLDIKRFGTAVLTQIETLQDRYGEHDTGKGALVVFDTSSPNIAKFMSVGHLRSTVIGEALARIYRASGYQVIRDNHLGDWGTQFGMLGRAVELWGDDIPELSGENPVVGLYKLYVKMHEEIEKEKEQLHATGRGEEDSQLATEGRAWFARLESGDAEALKLLEWARNMSLTEFQRVYDLLGVDFEYMIGESHYVPMLGVVVEALARSGLAQTDDKGRRVVPFDDKTKLEPLVVQKSDGTSLYATRDLATLVARTTWFNPAKIIYVVGGEQRGYFQQVFTTFNQWTGGRGPELEHVYFGMMKLPTGKMSTRKGQVVFLEDVLNEAVAQSRQKLEAGNRGFSEKEIEVLSRQIGAGAVIYFDLRQGRERDIEFDYETSLSLDENSAPYIQYAHTRAMGIMRVAEEAGLEIDTTVEPHFETEVEKELVKHLSLFAATMDKAREENQPSIVAEYTFRVADLFNRYYTTLKDRPFVREQDPVLRNTRLRLTRAAAQVIRNGLNLLAIEAPERM